jgi:hypothetical protein
MKSLYFFFSRSFVLIVVVAFTTNTMAQSLAFSQVKLVTAQETVPAGKVWKVESVIYNIPEASPSIQSSSGSCTSGNYNMASITIDGIPTKVGNGSMPTSYSNANYINTYTMLPVWLPEGKTLSGGSCLNKVSVIEFTIVP